MADDISKSLLRFALRNSGLEKPAIEPDDIDNENVRNIAKLSISKDKKVAKTGDMLLSIMAESEKNQSAKILIEHKKDLYKKKSIPNSLNATYDRKDKPSKDELLEFKDKWVEHHGHEYGWKKVAANHYKISYPTIALILNKL